MQLLRYIKGFAQTCQRSVRSICKVYAYTRIVKHNYVLGGMLFTIRKAQLHVSATNFGHHQVVQRKIINQIYMHL